MHYSHSKMRFSSMSSFSFKLNIKSCVFEEFMIEAGGIRKVAC